MKGFWGTMQKPLFVLAPMADVTDAAFRRIIAKYSKVDPSTGSGQGAVPYVSYTEFVSADGLARAPEEGRKKLLKDLEYSETERPIVAQFFTATPKHMEQAAALAQELGFDGVDLNMGCPADAVVRQGAGAELIKHPELAQELIAAAKQGAPNLPVSVKTRLGYNTDILEEWLPALLKAKPEVVIVHARTRKEMSLVPARWERIARAVEIRNEQGSDAYIIGNGDLKNIADTREKIAQTGADGGMLGRAIFGNPWLFAAETELSEKKSGRPEGGDPRTFSKEVLSQRLRVAVEHTKLFEELLGDTKNFALMKKHFKAYSEGFPGAKELRIKLMETSNAQEIEAIIEDFLRTGVY